MRAKTPRIITTPSPDDRRLFALMKEGAPFDFARLPNKHWVLAYTKEDDVLPSVVFKKNLKNKDALELLHSRTFYLSSSLDLFYLRWNKRDLLRYFRSSSNTKNVKIVAAILAYRYSDAKAFAYMEKKFISYSESTIFADIALAGSFLNDTNIAHLYEMSENSLKYLDRMKITDTGVIESLNERRSLHGIPYRAIMHAPLVSHELKAKIAKRFPYDRDEYRIFNILQMKSVPEKLLALADLGGHHMPIDPTLGRKIMRAITFHSQSNHQT